MNKFHLTYQDAKEKKWDMVYLSLADKLFITDKIPAKSIPRLIKNDILAYYDNKNKQNIVGLIVENVQKKFAKKKRFVTIMDFIDSRKGQEAVNIPLEEKYFKGISVELNSPD